jgi:hypothetical protein
VNKLGGSRGIYVWGKKELYILVLMWKLKGKRPLGRPGREWENNIKTDLHKIGLGSVEWISLARRKSDGLF